MIASFFVNLINWLIKGIGSILSFLCGVLPNSPFKIISNSPIAEYLPTLNYFLPISEAISILEVWLVCIASWYIYQIVLRWLKVIA